MQTIILLAFGDERKLEVSRGASLSRSTKMVVVTLAALVLGLGVLSLRLWRVAQASPHRSPEISKADRLSALRVAQDSGEWNNLFLGIPILQFPNDLMTYQRLLFEVKPDVVVETGTFHGGLTLYLAMVLENINERGLVLTVDMDDAASNDLRGSRDIRQSLKDRIRFFHGSSTDTGIVEQMAALAKGKRAIVILDSYHGRAHVAKELEAYSAFVQPGGYIVVNDTHLEGTQWLPAGDLGPAAAVADFLSAHAEFGRALPQPDFLVSCFHGGVLVRRR